MAAWTVLTLWMCVNLNAVPPATFNHVRSDEARVRMLIVEGYARSATFKNLVDAAEELPCVVYIATIAKLSQGMRGALLHQTHGLRQMPMLRVLLKANLSGDEAISVIGHELQHVVEAINGGGANGVSLTRVFAELDPDAPASGARKYETDAAVRATVRIRDELRASPRH